MLPVLAATTVVALLPVGIVWALRGSGVVSSPWLGAALAVALALVAACAGSAWWERRRTAGDRVFGDLLPWGRLRRWRAERALRNAVEVLAVGDAADTVDQRRLLQQVAEALDARDIYLDGHSRRVARHAAIVAQRMSLPAHEVDRIRAAATVHDIGKLNVAAATLHKPGRLTDAEFEDIKRHADDGARMVACLADPELTAIVRHHHERFDGTGYPDGVGGEEIPLGSRIIAVADTFDAITSPRPYRAATRHRNALAVLSGEAGVQFDPVVVRAFLAYYTSRRGLALWALLAAPVGRQGPALPVGLVAALGVTAAALPVASRLPAPGLAAPAPAQAAQRPPAAVRVAAAPVQASAIRRTRGPAKRPASRPRTSAAVTTTSRRLAAVTVKPARRVGAPRPRRLAGGPRSATPVPSTDAGRPPPPRRGPPSTVASTPTPTRTPGPPAAAPAPASQSAPMSTPAPVAASQAVAPSAAPPVAPARPTKDACKKGGYAAFGYANQGRCVSGH